MDAINTVFSVYGGASTGLLKLVASLFIFVLFTQGAAWMIASDRVQAIAGADGTFPRYFGVFSQKLGTPLRVNILSGVVATLFTIVATIVTSGSAGAAFQVVLNVAVSTLLISYLWIFLAAWILRRKYPHALRPYRVPGGRVGMGVATFVIYAWVVIGSWATVFPDTLERVFGVGYDFKDSWGVSQGTFEAFTLGTLAVITICCLVGYAVGRRTDTGGNDFSASIIAELEANERAHS
jgi:amino acid transporter